MHRQVINASRTAHRFKNQPHSKGRCSYHLTFSLLCASISSCKLETDDLKVLIKWGIKEMGWKMFFHGFTDAWTSSTNGFKALEPATRLERRVYDMSELKVFPYELIKSLLCLVPIPSWSESGARRDEFLPLVCCVVLWCAGVEVRTKFCEKGGVWCIGPCLIGIYSQLLSLKHVNHDSLLIYAIQDN